MNIYLRSDQDIPIHFIPQYNVTARITNATTALVLQLYFGEVDHKVINGLDPIVTIMIAVGIDRVLIADLRFSRVGSSNLSYVFQAIAHYTQQQKLSKIQILGSFQDTFRRFALFDYSIQPIELIHLNQEIEGNYFNETVLIVQ